ncbi:MAG: hypothetical protein WCS52_09080 [bacterium]
MNNQKKIPVIIWSCLTLAWCAWACVLWWPHIEPLTGMTAGGYLLNIGIQTGLMGGGLYLHIVRKTWRLVAGLLILIALFLVFPVPSYAGVCLEIRNTSNATTTVTVQRTGSQSRKVQMTVSPQGTMEYKTAPGDWSSGASFTVDCRQHTITTNIWVFRGRQIVVGENGIGIKVIRTMGRTVPPEAGASSVQ